MLMLSINKFVTINLTFITDTIEEDIRYSLFDSDNLISSLLIRHSYLTALDFVNDIVWPATLDGAADALGCPEHLQGSTLELSRLTSRPHYSCDVNNLIER